MVKCSVDVRRIQGKVQGTIKRVLSTALTSSLFI